MCAERRRTFALAITGASGALYAMRTMAALLERDCHLEVVISDYGRRLLHDELGDVAAVNRLRDYLVEKYGDAASRGSFTVLSNKDLGATIASGSHDCEGMAIVPCSMKTLAGVAHGLSRNLVERAADVMLKEKRRLVIVPRESPMSLPQLKNMVLCAEAGRDDPAGDAGVLPDAEDARRPCRFHGGQNPNRAWLRSDALPEVGRLRTLIGIELPPWPPMHPAGLRCSSLTYSRYARSSRLAGRAPRRPR